MMEALWAALKAVHSVGQWGSWAVKRADTMANLRAAKWGVSKAVQTADSWVASWAVSKEFCSADR